MKKFLRLFFGIVLSILSGTATLLAQGEVTRSGTTWTSRVNGNTVYTGAGMIQAIQSAANNLTPGRTSKQTINVRNSGTTGSTNSLKTFDIPSYTILNFHGNTMEVNDTGDDLIVPVRGIRSDNIEIRNMRITGNPRYGIWLHGCANVILSQIHISIPEASNIGLGIRIEGRNDTWSRNVEIDYVYAEHCRHHAVEIWQTDGLTIGTIETRNTGGCGLLLNNTRNATVELVNSYRANHGGGYAAFRTANNAGPNIHVKKVIARECARGIFGVSQSRGVTIDEVDIENSTSAGILVQDSWDYTVNGGRITGNNGEGVRIASRTDEHQPAQNVIIQNLCISGNLSYGIRETSTNSGFGNTNNNRFLNNDLRGSATNPANEISIQGSQSRAEGNCVTGGPVYPNCGCENTNDPDPEPDCNNQPGGSAEIDNCDVCVGGTTGKLPCSMVLNEGYYTMHPFHSNLCLQPGEPVSQESCGENSQNIWQVIRDGNSYQFYSIIEQQYLSYGNGAQNNSLRLSPSPSNFRLEEAGQNTFHLVVEANTDLVVDIHGNSQETGRHALLWIRNGQDNQRFFFTPASITRDCHGDIDGTATLDDCGTCVGGNTGQLACTGYIDGPAACVYEGVIENNHSGYHGSGFLNGDNALGNAITWSVHSESNQTGNLSFRHANGSAVNRNMEVRVNGETQIASLDFHPTGAWNEWKMVAANLNLSQGINLVELVSLTAQGGSNFDLIALYNAGITAGTCEEDCHGDIGGTAFMDNCEVCAGGNTGVEPGSSCIEPEINNINASETEINTGDSFTLDVTTSGPGTITYQWYFNGEPIENATGNSYTVENATPADHSGTYYVIVSSEYGDTRSEDVAVNVNPVNDCNGDPDGTAFIDNCEVCAGGNTGVEPGSSCTKPEISSISSTSNEVSTGESFTLNVDASGPGNHTYQWFFNNEPIENATENNLTVTNANPAENSGNYHVVVTSEFGSTQSDQVTVIVNPVYDCNNDPDGTAYIDNCGTCVGGNTDQEACAEDCNGDLGGSAFIDNCEVCAGGNTGIEPGSSCTEPEITSISSTANEVNTGESFTLNVETAGPGNHTYQWFFNNEPIENATENNLAVTNANPAENSGNYHVVVTSEFGSTQSESIGVTVNPIYDCNNDPDGTAYIDNCGTCVGGNTGEEACAEDCNGDLGGSAFMDNCEVCAGGNTGIEPGSSCTEPEISSISSTANEVNTGESFTLNVDAAGPGNHTYQWFFNNEPIENATENNLTLTNPNPAENSGNYHVVVTSEFGSIPSDQVSVTVNPIYDCNNDPDGTAYTDNCGTCVGGNTGIEPGSSCTEPEITSISSTANEVNTGESFTLQVDASGPGSFSYQWYFNNEPIENATENNLTITNANPAEHSGNYHVVVTSEFGSTPSDPVTVSVNPIYDCNNDPDGTAYTDNCGTCVGGDTGQEACAEDCNGDLGGSAFMDNCEVCAGGNTGIEPGFTCSQPVIENITTEITAKEGEEITLEVISTGPGNSTYQWYFNGEPIEGAEDPSFTIPSASLSDAGSYYVVITNDNGQTTSSDINVTIEVATSLLQPDSDKKLKIYPNPANETVYLQFGTSENRNIRIFNNLGIEVLHLESSQQTDVINISSLPGGVYHIKIESGGVPQYQSFIVQ
ncbi:MAG: immunoglobulin domain-containing protein [Cytophagaceae bacterium]